MKTLNKKRTVLLIVLTLLMAVCVFCGFALKPPTAAAATTSEVTYVFQNNSGGNNWADQSYNAIEVGFSLNTSDINNPYFSVFAFTDFSPNYCDYMTLYIWFEGTTGPNSSMSARDADSLSNVGKVTFFDRQAYAEKEIYLSSLASLPNNTTVNVYFAECSTYNQGEGNDWNFIQKVGTITKYVTTQQPLPVAPTKTGYTFTGWYTDEACTQKYTLDYITGNVTLYAGFRPNTYTINFRNDSVAYPNVTGSTASMSMTYDQAKNLPSSGFANPGYIFLGWDRDSRSQQPQYSAGQSVKNLVSTDGGSVTLYPIWAESKYTVAFNANGGTGTMTSQVISRDIATALKANAFTKTGYHFTGWATSAGGSVVHTDQKSVTNLTAHNGTITLYAVWAPNTYSITFNANGGTGTINAITATYDKSVRLPSSGVSRPGYILVGWEGPSRNYDPGESVSNLVASGSIELKAMWTESKYTVVFNSNGGTGTMTSQVISRDIATALTAGSFTRTGYTFAGWNTKADGTGTNYSDKQSVTNLAAHNGSITLYARWTPIAYTINFDGNKGDYPNVTGSTASLSMSYDTAKNLPSCGFTNTGYKFLGWDTDSRAQQPTYTAGQSVKNLVSTNNGSITLYAIWAEVNYNVAFNANGGSGTMSNQQMQVGIAEALNANTFTKTGYHFAGWAESATGAVKYADKQSVTSLASEGQTKTLYAVWEANTYSIAFDANGGTGTIEAITATYDKSVTLPSSGISRIGYTLVGWETPTRNYDLGESVSNLATSGTVTLKAMWTPKSYTVTFNANGGSCSTPSKDVVFDSTYGTLPTPTRAGYTFQGWFTAASGGTQVTDSTKVSITAAQTLYAQWKANSYTVTFNANGGSCSTPSKDVTYDSTYGTLPEATRDGYKFLGWFTATSGGTQVTADTKVTITDAQTLYAHWQANTYTVVFNGNGHTGGSMSNLTMTYDKAQALTANGFTKTGYHFVGWATSAAGSKAYDNAQSVTNIAGTNSTVTLYAIWEANEYTVVFNNNDGSNTTSTQKFTYDTVENLDEKDLTREGYIFMGWSKSQGGNVSYVDGAPVENLTATQNGTVTLYAVWKPIQCTVTFIVDGEVFAVVTVDWGTPSEEVIGQAVNSVLYEPEGDYPN